MLIKNTEVFNFEGAFRGMRNALESWAKRDSHFNGKEIDLGENDLALAKRLIKAGPSHRKFLRQIFVSADITAPLYWWKEFDTYKINTTANSTSTMHKLASTPITLSCFEAADLSKESTDILSNYVFLLEQLRLKYLETKDKKYWKDLIIMLPNSWLQTRTWTANYEVLYSIYEQRKGHKLTEWAYFLDWIADLPCFKELFIDN